MFGLVNFVDVDEDFALGALGQIQLQFLNLSALASDDDARPRSADGDAQLIARPVDFDRTDARRFQTRPQIFFQFQVFSQQLGIIRAGEPARTPRLVEAQPEPVWMYFLSHLKLSPRSCR